MQKLDLACPLCLQMTQSSVVHDRSLQHDLDKVAKWAAKWQMRFSVDKCKVIHFGANPPPHAIYIMNGSILGKSTIEKISVYCNC